MHGTLLRFGRVFFCLLILPVAAFAATPDKDLHLTVGKAQLISFDQAAATIYVAEPAIAGVVAPMGKRLLVSGKRPGTTTLFALNSAGGVIYSANVQVGYDLDGMQQGLARDFPGLKFNLTPIPNGVAVSGVVANAQQATQVIALLDAFVKVDTGKGMVTPPEKQGQSNGADDKGGAAGAGALAARNGRVLNRLTITESNQVTIRIRIAEVSRSVSEKIGLKWNQGGTFNGNAFAIAQSPVSSGLNSLIKQAVAGATAGQDVTALIDALAQEKLVSVLAEPNLTVLSGETASFLAGGQLPFPVLQDSDMGIEFKDYGILLDITPTVLSNQRISLRVRPEVSEPDYANGVEMKGFTMPGFRVRRADTTVELASGQSFALAGLIQNDLTNHSSKLPGLGDLPILGALARSKEFKKGESELVIIATAYLSQPTAAPLSVPNEYIKQGSPVERHLLDAQPLIGAQPAGANQDAK